MITINNFADQIKANEGVIIFKFSAGWCGPCSRIKPLVESWVERLKGTPTIQIVYVDIDESIELYSFLKTKKRIRGVPTLLAYWKGNTNYIENDAVIGADLNQVNAFFQRCC